MRRSLKSGLILLLSGIVLGSTLLIGCKEEKRPTKQNNITMVAKIDEKTKTTQVQEEKQTSEKIPESSTTPVFYINETEELKTFDRYTLRLQTRLTATREVFLRSVHTGPKITIKTEDGKKGIASYPQEEYVFFSEKVNKSPMKFLDQANPIPLQDKRKIEEILQEIKEHSSRKISFNKDQVDAYVFTREEFEKSTPKNGYLTIEGCGNGAVQFTRKKEISNPEIYVATYTKLRTIDRSKEERIFIAIAQGRAYPPYLTEFEGYWLDPDTDIVFCMNPEKLFTKRKTGKRPEKDFSETATLYKKNLIYLDEDKKESLKCEKDNKGKRMFYIDLNGRKNSLRQITAQEAGIY